jgi:hypothetical protein
VSALSTRPARLALALAAVLAATPAALRAQRPVRATGVRGIAFGVVLPGVPQPVPRTDATRSAQFDLTGPNRSELLVTFTLPSVLTAGGGGAIPIVFGASDAGYSASQSIASQIPFDPALPFTATLSNNGRGSIFLGATLQPGAAAPPGGYTAPVTITLANVGT